MIWGPDHTVDDFVSPAEWMMFIVDTYIHMCINKSVVI